MKKFQVVMYNSNDCELGRSDVYECKCESSNVNSEVAYAVAHSGIIYIGDYFKVEEVK